MQLSTCSPVELYRTHGSTCESKSNGSCNDPTAQDAPPSLVSAQPHLCGIEDASLNPTTACNGSRGSTAMEGSEPIRRVVASELPKIRNSRDRVNGPFQEHPGGLGYSSMKPLRVSAVTVALRTPSGGASR